MLALAVAAMLVSSCAYYNTFYLARKYYFKATAGAPYEVDRQGAAQAANYSKAIDYCKKVIAQYPKSKWVDDAYLLWAQALVGRDDPLQTVNMLQDFTDRFPRSDQKAAATFFLGLGYRNARRYKLAVDAFDEFLQQSPKHPLAPYAYVERARALQSLGRYGESAEAAGQVLERFPHHALADLARRQRAEARLLDGNFDGAREDFHVIGNAATSDQERFNLLMREADCLEAGRRFDDELALLRAELSHTPPPPAPTGTGTGTGATSPTAPGASATYTPGALGVAAGSGSAPTDRYGRLTIRIGTAELLAGRVTDAIDQYSHVLQDYPRSAMAAEAQYRIGYAVETGLEDFDRALQEYGKVKEQFGLTQYTQQASARSEDLGRIMQYRKGGGADSLEKKAEAGFLTAERYLFDLKRPERALEEYAAVARDYPGTAVAGRALNAEAWVLSRKLDRATEADSILWAVVHQYPGTEAQLAARDYLEGAGQEVPDSLIVPPKTPEPPARDSTAALTPVPATPALGAAGKGLFGAADSLARVRPPGITPLSMVRDSVAARVGTGPFPPGMPRDSLGRPRAIAPPAADTTRREGPH
jgi:TolA-binding protein